VKAIDPDLTVSMSPSYYDWALYEYLQDSYTWTNRGLVDSIHPQAYRYDLAAYKKIVDDLVTNQFTKEQLPLLAPGLLVKSGKYVIPEDYFLAAIAYNREKGINGEVHFFYTGLRENDSKLLNLLKSGPYAQPASLPYRETLRRPGMVELAPLPGEGSTTPFGIKAPIDGVFDIYGKAAPGAKAPVSFDLRHSNSKTVTLQPTDATFADWTKIATEDLDRGESIIVDTTGSAQVMMLINHKATLAD